MSTVQRHSEEELRQQWAFLDALVDRQAASLKSGVQDPEEDDLTAPVATADALYAEEISVLTRRVTTLEGERATLLRRIDLAEQARIAAETARAAAEAARAAAEHTLATERRRLVQTPPAAAVAARPPTAAPPPAVAPAPEPPAPFARPRPAAAAPRRRSWWDRLRR